MFEVLFLLLPIAAAYGYYMGRVFSRSKKQEEKNTQNTNYLRGVEYLLDNKQDKAVDKFIAYLNASDPSFESGLALGNLFRKRGEVDKAISLHDKMASDPNLEESEHELSQLELARDFTSAGLLDRAEAILKTLVEIPRQRSRSAALLLKVYERERDFDRAIGVALEHRDVLGASVNRELGQYYCERANSLLLHGKTQEAVAAYKYALDVFANSLRARLELAQILINQKKLKEAYSYLKQASSLDSRSGLLCLDYLIQCFPNKADPQYRFALEDLIHHTHSAAAMVELVRVTEQNSGVTDAEAMLLSFIKEKNNLKLYSALMGLRSRENNVAQGDALMQLKSLVDAQLAQAQRFACHNCGFESRMMFWQCPSCRKWESLKTRVGLDGD